MMAKMSGRGLLKHVINEWRAVLVELIEERMVMEAAQAQEKMFNQSAGMLYMKGAKAMAEQCFKSA